MSNILIASAYKSGSNHIADSLAALLGSSRTYLNKPGEGWAQDPQRLDHYTMDIMFNHLNGMVYLQHVLGTKYNLGLIKAFKPFVIITMRKLIPSLHSLRKYGDIMVEDGRWDDKYLVEWPKLSNDEKWAWVAINTIPWYYQFYVSWMSAQVPRHIVWFDDHFKDQVKSTQEMLNFLGVEKPPEEIEAAFNHKNSNYTKDRTELEVPGFVKNYADAAALAWGKPWAQMIQEDLLAE